MISPRVAAGIYAIQKSVLIIIGKQIKAVYELCKFSFEKGQFWFLKSRSRCGPAFVEEGLGRR
jgi:hypothetical protein